MYLQSTPGVTRVGARVGYWRFRQDFPAQSFMAFTDQRSFQDAITLTVKGTKAAPRDRGASVARVLDGMARNHLATATSAAPLLKGLTDEPSPWLVKATPESELRFSLGEKARHWLGHWRKAGLLDQSEKATDRIDAVASGAIGYRAALHDLLPDDPARCETMARQIDALCERWQGLGRDAGLKVIRKQQAGVPHHEGLPAWIDLESQLPKDHPWRQVRIEVEATLSARYRDWISMASEERAQRRLEWLTRNARDPELLAHLEGPLTRFDAIRYWLTGMR